jgi:hypothetical protein
VRIFILYGVLCRLLIFHPVCSVGKDILFCIFDDVLALANANVYGFMRRLIPIYYPIEPILSQLIYK